MNAESIAAITLWVLIAAVVIALIVWISCECAKSCGGGNTIAVQSGCDSDTAAVVVRHKDTGGSKQEQHKNNGGMSKGGSGASNASSSPPPHKSSNWDDMEQPFASGQPPLAYHPYGGDKGSAASAHGANYPTEESEAARFPRNPPMEGSDVAPIDSVCAPANGSKHGYNLDVDHLMPSGWRDNNGNCGSESIDSTQWAAYAPSKESFRNYNTTAGAARLSVNTRNPTARTIGLPNLVADAVRGCGAGGPAVPIGDSAVLFNDSDLRQNAIYNSIGKYPNIQDTWC